MITSSGTGVSDVVCVTLVPATCVALCWDWKFLPFRIIFLCFSGRFCVCRPLCELPSVNWGASIFVVHGQFSRCCHNLSTDAICHSLHVSSAYAGNNRLCGADDTLTLGTENWGRTETFVLGLTMFCVLAALRWQGSVFECRIDVT